MLDPALLNYYSKPTYHYERKLAWEQHRPASGRVVESVADQFAKAQGEENLISSLQSPAVRALLKAEVNIEKTVVLAYQADKARARMDKALLRHLGSSWKQDNYSLKAPQPGDNHSTFSASCGKDVHQQTLRIVPKEQLIELMTRGKSETGRACHVISARYNPADGKVIEESITSNWYWNQQ